MDAERYQVDLSESAPPFSFSHFSLSLEPQHGEAGEKVEKCLKNTIKPTCSEKNAFFIQNNITQDPVPSDKVFFIGLIMIMIGKQ